ncbi:D-amino acid dehydrogenase [Rhizobacter sp. SG703]|uniref:D-amino acid dehydrogenase n=1 Tax=Rhizobacter sp. SG703 TaxID=2587140 RepID=UPI00144862D3|nr:D-amino acid dehydrogenase [Rhizobacter sp. SG703]NKI94371.1 D-amino-acid dehydrogenase [Rhizobacter sp. SG703]
MKHVCVVGAGVIGSATALALAREGIEVTLVDAADRPGQGASRANGAQLSYSYVEPLATPAALRALPGWLLSRDSPLSWQPRWQASHWRWLAAFIGACSQARVQQTTEVLLRLSFLSRDVLARWQHEHPLGVQVRQAGKLVIHRDPAKRDAAQRQVDWQARFGCRQLLLDADACRQREPALAHDRAPIAFGIWTPDEAVTDAQQLSRALAEASRARWRMDTRVAGFVQRDGRVQALRCVSAGGAEREIEADAFVVAAGPGAAALLQPLGIQLPIEPIKGYSISLQVANAARAPQVSVTDAARKLVYARLGEQVRIAGFAELRGADLRIDPRRIAAMLQAATDTFPGAFQTGDPQPWAGLRPATPGSRPLIGPTRVGGLWLNTGHGALGLTLACGSAWLLAQLMQGRSVPIDASPFKLAS